MTDSAVNYELNSNGIATLCLNRPEVGNAFNDVMIQQIIDLLERINSDTQVRVVILRSSGKHFSAGADLNWMKSMAAFSQKENKKDSLKLSLLMDSLYRLNKPTIACVQGAAFGGAIGLIACCDIALTATDSKFCLSETKLGLSPAVISPYVISAIGARAAHRYFLTAEVFDAACAQRLNLVHEITTTDTLLEKANELATLISLNGPIALKETKALIHQVEANFPRDDLREYTADLIARLRVSDEGQEGISAFFEKRKANWQAK